LTTFLAVRYFDKLLQKLVPKLPDLPTELTENQVQDILFPKYSPECIAATCLLTSSKFDELDDNIPLSSEIAKAFSSSNIVMKKLKQQRRSVTLKPKDILQCEFYLLCQLDWNLNLPTVFTFV
jgi:Cyclin, N-terminal domain